MAQNSGQQVVTPHGVSNATVGLVRARQVNSARICTPRLRLSHESTSAGKQLEFAYRSIATSDRNHVLYLPRPTGNGRPDITKQVFVVSPAVLQLLSPSNGT